MANPVRIYWDACIWISLINEERAVPQKDGSLENRVGMCQDIIRQAEGDEYEKVVSAFTLAEVCKSSEAKNESPSKLPSFLDHSFILMVNVDKDVALKAQSLQVSGIAGLKPADAVHIASAQRANVEQFHTFDTRLLNLDGQIAGQNGKAIKICKPGNAKPLEGLFGEGVPDA